MIYFVISHTLSDFFCFYISFFNFDTPSLFSTLASRAIDLKAIFFFSNIESLQQKMKSLFLSALILRFSHTHTQHIRLIVKENENPLKYVFVSVSNGKNNNKLSLGSRVVV